MFDESQMRNRSPNYNFTKMHTDELRQCMRAHATLVRLAIRLTHQVYAQANKTIRNERSQTGKMLSIWLKSIFNLKCKMKTHRRLSSE